MTGVFDGIRVLELTWGMAGPMVGMVLADQGALVTRVEPPDGQLSDHPGHRVWNRGKRSAVLDLTTASGREVFWALVDDADVVIDSLRPGATTALGLGPQELLARNPRVIACSVTGYGSGSEHQDRPGYEALVAARSGSQWAQRGGIMSTADLNEPEVDIPEGAEQAARSNGPIFSATPWMSVNGFYHASVAVGAALVARERTGRGQHVEASMLPRVAFLEGNEKGTTEGTWMSFRGAPRGLFECADGRWVHQWPLKPLTVIQAAESERLEDAPAPEYDHIRNDPNRIGMEPERIIELFHWFPLMQAAFKRFPSEDWVLWGRRVKEGVQPVRTPEESLLDPSLADDGSVVEVHDPELGPIRHLGLVAELHATPGRVQGPAPRRGEHTDEVVAEARRATAARPAAAPATRTANGAEPIAQPLTGIRIIDLGLALAGPYGTSLLADLGADVIKVNAPWDGPWMETGIGQLANRGKRSLVLDLGRAEGMEALRELVVTADVVSHNMRDGVAERIGIGAEDLRALKSDLIYVESRGFDRFRSSLNIPGTDHAGSALAGQEWEDGGCWNGGRPFFGTSMGDLGNGFLVAVATLHALYHRARTGEGQIVSTSILSACLLASSSTYVHPDGTGPERARLDRLQLGFSACYRLYETADGWICLAALRESHWRQLCTVADSVGLAGDPRFVDGAGRARHDEELGQRLEELFSQRSADEWFAILDAAGVPIEVSDRAFRLPEPRPPYLHLSDTPASISGPAPQLGAHTQEILAELGYPDGLESVPVRL